MLFAIILSCRLCNPCRPEMAPEEVGPPLYKVSPLMCAVACVLLRVELLTFLSWKAGIGPTCGHVYLVVKQHCIRRSILAMSTADDLRVIDEVLSFSMEEDNSTAFFSMENIHKLIKVVRIITLCVL